MNESESTVAAPPLRPDTQPVIGLGTVFTAWWPLAASWLLMGLELPAVSAMMARLTDPTVSLAAYGGVVFPLALMIESPIVMLLTASTALSKDRASYRTGRRFMFAAAGVLTLLHALIAFTPLYDFVVGGLLAPPAEVLEPARLGLRIMLPWTLSIAYRRFQQGVLIRFGRSRSIGVGTAVRLAANAVVLGLGWALHVRPGILVGTCAVTCGVMSEAMFAGFAVRPVLRHELPDSTPGTPSLTMRKFLHFYIPLAITPMFMFFAMPLATGAMSRMPRAMESLAAWPVVNGLVFTMRSVGFGLNEVVVSMLERPRALPALRRFAVLLGAGTSLLLAVTALTPLAGLWFARVSALPARLATLAATGLLFAFLLPGLTALQSLFQGAVVHRHETRIVTESMAVYIVVVAAALAVGVAHRGWTGLFVGLASQTLGGAAQLGWLVARSRGALTAIESAVATDR